MKRRGILKEMRKVTSRNRAHRWRISSLRPRRAPRSLFHLTLPCNPAPAHLKPKATFGYTSVWRILHESEKWASSWFLKVKNERVPRVQEGKEETEWERARSLVLVRTLFRSRFPPSLHPPRSTNTRCSRVWGQYESCHRAHEYTRFCMRMRARACAK